MVNKSILKSCGKEGFKEQEVFGAYKIFFGTLVSEPRLKIINLLRKSKKNVSEITKELKMDQTLVSHNLSRLRDCGFVSSDTDGKFRYYSLNKKTIAPLMTLIDEHMKEHCVHILKKNSKGGRK